MNAEMLVQGKAEVRIGAFDVTGEFSIAELHYLVPRESVVSSVFPRINRRSHGFMGGRKFVANVGSSWGTNTTIRRPPTVVNLYSLFSDPNCGRWIPSLFRRKSCPSWRTMQPPRVWELSNSRRCVVRESVRGSF